MRLGPGEHRGRHFGIHQETGDCLLYTSDAADERSSVDLGGRRIIKKKNKNNKKKRTDKTNYEATERTLYIETYHYTM